VSTKLSIFALKHQFHITTCTGERTFPVLKRVKNDQRASLGECKLSALACTPVDRTWCCPRNPWTVFSDEVQKG